MNKNQVELQRAGRLPGRWRKGHNSASQGKDMILHMSIKCKECKEVFELEKKLRYHMMKKLPERWRKGDDSASQGKDMVHPKELHFNTDSAYENMRIWKKWSLGSFCQQQISRSSFRFQDIASFQKLNEFPWHLFQAGCKYFTSSESYKMSNVGNSSKWDIYRDNCDILQL